MHRYLDFRPTNQAHVHARGSWLILSTPYIRMYKSQILVFILSSQISSIIAVKKFYDSLRWCHEYDITLCNQVAIRKHENVYLFHSYILKILTDNCKCNQIFELYKYHHFGTGLVDKDFHLKDDKKFSIIRM